MTERVVNEEAALLFLYAETPLHVGSGASLGAVDLPIQRERMSRLPMIQGSGLKGAWREVFEQMHGEKDALTLKLFGPPPPEAGTSSEAAEEFAGALALADARLLLFPVRTVWGGWAWTTSPMVLQRLARDLELTGRDAAPTWSKIAPGNGEALIGVSCAVVDPAARDALIVEDLEFSARRDSGVDELATWLAGAAIPSTPAYKPFRERLAGQLVVVSDGDFTFLTEHATEVVARVRINGETGAVAKGALWSEEALPAESLLWTLAFVSDSRRPAPAEGGKIAARDLHKAFTDAAQDRRIRLGGDRTVGRGLVGVRVRMES